MHEAKAKSGTVLIIPSVPTSVALTAEFPATPAENGLGPSAYRDDFINEFFELCKVYL